MESDKRVQSPGTTEVLSAEERVFLQDVVAQDRREHHGRVSPVAMA